jgi:hypothetical protein
VTVSQLRRNRRALIPIKDRFYRRVKLPDENGCMNWEGATNGRGYGQLQVKRKNLYAHRLSYMLMVGPIPDDLVLDHLCRNRRCCNPLHLEPVTVSTNTIRGVIGEKNTARAAAQTKCKHGHPRTRENTLRRGTAYSGCRVCANERDRARYKREKEGKS